MVFNATSNSYSDRPISQYNPRAHNNTRLIDMPPEKAQQMLREAKRFLWGVPFVGLTEESVTYVYYMINWAQMLKCVTLQIQPFDGFVLVDDKDQNTRSTNEKKCHSTTRDERYRWRLCSGTISFYKWRPIYHSDLSFRLRKWRLMTLSFISLLDDCLMQGSQFLRNLLCFLF